MSKAWFDNRLPYIIDDTSEPIDLYRFRGLFMITGGSSAFALAVLLIMWIRDRWKDLMSSINVFLSRRGLVHFRILFAGTIHPILSMTHLTGIWWCKWLNLTEDRN